MRKDQITRFNKYFAEKDPELYNLFAPYLTFIERSDGSYGVANMMGTHHYTEEQGEKLKQIALDFEEVS